MQAKQLTCSIKSNRLTGNIGSIYYPVAGCGQLFPIISNGTTSYILWFNCPSKKIVGNFHIGQIVYIGKIKFIIVP